MPTQTLHLITIANLSLLPFVLDRNYRTQKLERIADELMSLNPIELHDYTILFRLKNSASASLSDGLDASAGGQPGGADTKPAEKTVFNFKLEKFDAAKIIKKVRSFTDLGLEEAKNLVEKTPIVVKKGVTKEEGDSIVEKLKQLEPLWYWNDTTFCCYF